MKFSTIFKKKLNCNNSKEVFDYLVNNLNDSITYWDYFVNWNKVGGNIRDFEVDLNIFNYLIGKNNIEKELRYILKKHPQTIRLIPVLLACRENNFKILTDFTTGTLTYENFSFESRKELSDTEISKVIKFTNETGLLKLFQEKTIKNIVDYAIGVEVGLDSNGRKNRRGTAMEKIVETFIKSFCSSQRFVYMPQATSDKVKAEWEINLRVDKSSRRFDFGVYNNKTLYLIEANYYGGGGSKLKSTAGEYKSTHDFLTKQGHKFIWITDGIGWKTTSRPLEETFNHIDYLLNLKMLTNGLLEDIIKFNL